MGSAGPTVETMYKDSQFAARCRREELLRAWSAVPDPEALGDLLGRRQARVAAGLVGLLGAGFLVGDLAFGARHGAFIIPIAWLSATLMYCLVRLSAAMLWRPRFRGGLRATQDPFSDLARLEAGGPRRELLVQVRGLEVTSFALPVMALSLMAPLSLHWLVGLALMGSSAVEFARWIAASLMLVGHAHLILMVLSLRHVFRVRAELSLQVPQRPWSRGLWALLWTVAASAVPGALLMFVPPILVTFTGIAFVPWMFHWVSSRLSRERAVLDIQPLGI